MSTPCVWVVAPVVVVVVAAGGLDSPTLCPQKTFKGQGSSSVSNPHPSDLIVRVKVLGRSGFRREGADLYGRVNITLDEAMHGFSRNFTNYDGTVFPLAKSGVSFQGSCQLCTQLHMNGM